MNRGSSIFALRPSFYSTLSASGLQMGGLKELPLFYWRAKKAACGPL